MVKTDKVGEELNIGDWVIIPDSHYNELHFAIILKFSKLKMYVKYRNRSSRIIDPSVCIKIVDQDYLARIMLEKVNLFP